MKISEIYLEKRFSSYFDILFDVTKNVEFKSANNFWKKRFHSGPVCKGAERSVIIRNKMKEFVKNVFIKRFVWTSTKSFKNVICLRGLLRKLWIKTKIFWDRLKIWCTKYICCHKIAGQVEAFLSVCALEFIKKFNLFLWTNMSRFVAILPP